MPGRARGQSAGLSLGPAWGLPGARSGGFQGFRETPRKISAGWNGQDHDPERASVRGGRGKARGERVREIESTGIVKQERGRRTSVESGRALCARHCQAGSRT